MIIDKLSGSRVHFEVNVSKETFEHALDHAFEKVIQETEIKGFRKGKAPRHIYEAKYGVKSLYEEAIQHALEDTYYHTVTENEIDVVSQPKIDLDVASVERGKDFVYQVTVAVRPEIQLGTYFDLEVKSLPIEVSDAEIEAKLTAEREKHAEMVIKETGILENGDTAVFDFSGSVNGELFPGGTAENHELEIGSNRFIPGFEAQMVGMQAESEKDIIVTFPEDYHEKSLAGKEAVFAVKLHEIKTRVVPELNDDLVKEFHIDQVETVAQLKAHYLKELETLKTQENETHIRSSVIAQATENAIFDLPEEMIKDEAKRLDENNVRQIKQYNLDFEVYLQYMGKTKEQYQSELTEQATKTLRQQLVIEAIGKKENVEVLQAEIDEKYNSIAQQYQSQNVTIEQVKNAIPESAIKEEVIFKKTIDLLVEKAKVVN
jgi:trigger factor